MTERLRRVSWLLLLPLLLGAGVERTEPRADCAHFDALRRPFFGDLHVHTAYSLDASTQGTRNLPIDAYRFARGESIGLQPYAADGGPLRRARLAQPLDFAAVTDHSELFGELSICSTPGLPGHDSITCRIYRRWPRLAFFLINSRGSVRFEFCGPDGTFCEEAARGPWADIQQAAELAYDRTPACRFTSFVGFEWTARGPGASNLHRNVIFRNQVVPEVALNAIDQPTKEALWDGLAETCRAEGGCEAVVIPHNSNISGGLMFRTESADGSPLDAVGARLRQENEPLVEVMQHKGDSECSRSTAPADELCGFEELPYDRFVGRYLPIGRKQAGPLNFTRHALAEGLVQYQRLGVNPFKFGVIASTDTHIATPGLVSEEGHPGHGGAGTHLGDLVPDALLDPIEFNPGGLAVLWAEENSRDALFLALRRREAYGTSGPRIIVRFFGGWDYPDDLCQNPRFVSEGYAKGVPMGGDLPPREGTRSPVFAVWALRDPAQGERPPIQLQRVQIVKAWLANGEAREAVIEVAGDPMNGASIDLATCLPRGPGFSQLCSVWTDPDFDSRVPALYYARVVENPSCRWNTYACSARRVDCADRATVPRGFAPCCDPANPKTIQERAWTSPIWYTPQKAAAAAR